QREPPRRRQEGQFWCWKSSRGATSALERDPGEVSGRVCRRCGAERRSSGAPGGLSDGPHKRDLVTEPMSRRALPPTQAEQDAMTFDQSRAVVRLVKSGMVWHEAIATVVQAGGETGSRKLPHASVCRRALAVVRRRGWEPRLQPEDYEAIAAAGFYEKTLPLA